MRLQFLSQHQIRTDQPFECMNSRHIQLRLKWQTNTLNMYEFIYAHTQKGPIANFNFMGWIDTTKITVHPPILIFIYSFIFLLIQNDLENRKLNDWNGILCWESVHHRLFVRIVCYLQCYRFTCSMNISHLTISRSIYWDQ